MKHPLRLLLVDGTALAYGGANAGRNRRAGRDPRLDLFRGLSLIFIFIDHIPNNVLSYATLHSVAFSDAAEVFVFISGYTAAMFYGKALQQQGWLVATAQIYRRVWQLYVAHIVIFVIFAAEVSYATVNIHNHTYSGDLGLDTFLDEPHVAVVKTVLLQYQPAFLDILPLYVVLLGAFPLVLLLLELHLLLPLALSGAIYLLTLRFGWHPHSYPGGEGWYFNPLAWQCLFVIGATAGYFANSRQILPPRDSWLWKLAMVVTVVVGVINISWVIHGAHSAFPGLLLQELSPFVVDKTNLAPLRLLSFFAIAVTTVHFVRDNSELLRWRAAQLIIQCGRHSLQVFCLGILLSVLGRILLTSFHDDILMQLAIDLAGIALMAGIARLLTWYANNAVRWDAAIAGHTSPAARRWNIAGNGTAGGLTEAIVRSERHVIVHGERHLIAWTLALRRMWPMGRNQAATRSVNRCFSIP